MGTRPALSAEPAYRAVGYWLSVAQYEARFFFDPGSGRCLWAANDLTRETFDYPINHEELPLPPETLKAIDRLLQRFDESLNWDYPPSATPWTQEECREFNLAAENLLERIRSDLGPEWDVRDEFYRLPGS